MIANTQLNNSELLKIVRSGSNALKTQYELCEIWLEIQTLFASIRILLTILPLVASIEQV